MGEYVAQTGSKLVILNDSIGTSTGYTTTGMSTAYGEALGDASGNSFVQEMAFSIEKSTVTVKSRSTKKQEYTMELAQDIKQFTDRR